MTNYAAEVAAVAHVGLDLSGHFKTLVETRGAATGCGAPPPPLVSNVVRISPSRAMVAPDHQNA